LAIKAKEMSDDLIQLMNDAGRHTIFMKMMVEMKQ